MSARLSLAAIRTVLDPVVSVGSTVNVSGATFATPIVVTTSTPHGLITGDVALIAAVGGNTNANGYRRVTKQKR